MGEKACDTVTERVRSDPVRTEGPQQDWGRVFNRLLDRYRRDDGSRWGGKSLERATGGYVSHQYVGHLKAGRINEPSFGKIYAINKAMGVPLEGWVQEEGEQNDA